MLYWLRCEDKKGEKGERWERSWRTEKSRERWSLTGQGIETGRRTNPMQSMTVPWDLQRPLGLKRGWWLSWKLGCFRPVIRTVFNLQLLLPECYLLTCPLHSFSKHAMICRQAICRPTPMPTLSNVLAWQEKKTRSTHCVTSHHVLRRYPLQISTFLIDTFISVPLPKSHDICWCMSEQLPFCLTL